MKYDNIQKGVFLKRPNRFIAEVNIDGNVETVHVKNTGRCKELLIPGCEVYLTAPGGDKRKTKYDLVAVKKSTGVLFNIDSQAPNKVVKEWLNKGSFSKRITDWIGYKSFSKVVPEYKYGDSRIDFYMENEKGKKFLMEVKGCTLERDGVGYFPDAPTERGVKHIRELIKAKEEGYESALAFVIQMDGVSEVLPNVETHPEFGVAFEDAKKAGVKIFCLRCHVENDELVIVGD